MEKMTFYEISDELAKCFDEETGEILDEGKWLELQGALEDKIEGVGLMIKNREMLKNELKLEKQRIADRIATLDHQIENTKTFLGDVLKGSKFETAKVRMSWRKSKSVEIVQENEIPEQFLKVKTTTAPDKTAIKEALQSGEQVPGCNLKETNNLSVK